MFKEFRIYLTEDNDFEFLKISSSKILLDKYLTHIVCSEFNLNDWNYWSINFFWEKSKTEIKYKKFYEKLKNQCKNFGLNNRGKIFKKYNIHRIVEELKNSESIKKCYESNRRLLDIDNFKNCYDIYFNKTKKAIYIDGFVPDNNDGFNVSELKRLINDIIFYNFHINFDRENLRHYKLKLLIDDLHEIHFRGGEFLTNWNLISYKEFKDLHTEYNLNQSESLYLILHFDKLYSKQKTIGVLKRNTLFQNKEDFTKKFNIKNNYNEDILDTLKNEYGNGRIREIIDFEGKIIESQFSTFQAFHICKGLKNQRPLYNKYINNKFSQEDKFKAHQLANDLLKSKGKVMIDFILSLPTLPFQCENYKLLFSILDNIRSKQINQNPIIRLKLKNQDGKEEEIEFSFYSVDNSIYKNQIRIKKSNLNICDISRDGKVIPEENTIDNGRNKNITPILQFFYRITKNTDGLNQAILSYGRETGKCSVCGKALEDERSIAKGIGPICEKYIV
ncbi:hypothetical protein EIB75_03080 [Epilithonimonas vandammei]|uniref:Uncharacterized protein n=1 Tax=Epilithonimonas vandammei TaxID=2487072 RepID=A0A3G8ZC62_9FLAO|nr:DUF6011 domain-containing protein [Epilithonimonas vandammei]AZI54305.1 hypothetical protein EIB75_03080 [Epilithonimonas vandammei]